MQVIGHGDPVIAATERAQGVFRHTALQIDLLHRAARPGERPQRLDIAVDSRHAETHIEK